MEVIDVSEEKKNIDPVFTSSVTDTEVHVFTEQAWQNYKKEEEERREYIHKKIFKIGSIALFLLVMFIFASIAWFTMSREVGSDGMSMTTVGDLFNIEPLGDPAHAGIYDDASKNSTYVRDKLMSEAEKTGDIITWTITDDEAVTDSETGSTTVTKGKNLGNGPAEGYEGGISPGSSGEIQFIIKPSVPVNAEFDFYVYSYSGGYDEYGDEDKTKIAIIDGTSGSDERIAKLLLNGHILLFKNIDENGKYSGLLEVDSEDDLKRIMEESYSSQTTVSIYWIWPETLAEIILDENNSAQRNNLRGKRNICNSTGKSEIISLFKNKPEWFLLDPDNGTRSWASTFNPDVSDENVINTINSNYSLYSSYYNEADQHIGTYVSYIFVDMTASGDAVNNTDSEP